MSNHMPQVRPNATQAPSHAYVYVLPGIVAYGLAFGIIIYIVALGLR